MIPRYTGPPPSQGTVIFDDGRSWEPKSHEKGRINQRSFYVNRMVVMMEMKKHRFIVALRVTDTQEDLICEATEECQTRWPTQHDMLPDWVLVETCEPYPPLKETT